LYHAGATLSAGSALAAWSLAAATFFLIGMLLGDGLAVSTLAQLTALALLPVAVLRLHEVPLASLGLARPPIAALVGAGVAGTCTWYLSLRVALPIVEATDRHEQLRDATRAVTGDGATLPLVLVASAVVPGVCEEILHRGVLLPALRARAGTAIALVSTTLLFAVMHIEPARMASAAVIGGVAGTFAVLTRTLWPAIILHTVNNAVALILGTGHLPAVQRLVSGHPDTTLALASAGTLAGLALAGASRPRG
jgi:sodium transport system permease protein